MASYWLEAGVVGLATLTIGIVVTTIYWAIFASIYNRRHQLHGEHKVPLTQNGWGYLQMVVVLFVTGCLVHILAQWTGVNEWYCFNGDACLQAYT